MYSPKESLHNETEGDSAHEKRPHKIYKMILIGNTGVGKDKSYSKSTKE